MKWITKKRFYIPAVILLLIFVLLFFASDMARNYIEKNSIIEIQVNPGSYTINFTPKPGYLKEEKNDNNQEFIS